jgi:hypothetical protein
MDDYRGYVNQTEAARLIGVSGPTLSRRPVAGVRLGGRDIGISPSEVLRWAEFFKRRPLTEVAGELVERAYRLGPDVAKAVSAEVDEVLSARPSLRPAVETDFLDEARRVLPRRLFAQVARYYRESSAPPAALTPAEEPAPVPHRSPSGAASKLVHRRDLVTSTGLVRDLATIPTKRARRAIESTAPASAEPRGLAQKA